MLPEPISEQQQYAIALAFAEQLAGVSITQALYILQELTPQLITNSHRINKDAIIAAGEQLLSGGSV
jgi:hypothetical protein